VPLIGKSSHRNSFSENELRLNYRHSSIRPTRARAGLHTSLNVRQQIRAHRPVRLFLFLLPPDLAPVGEEQELP
jgi:hypothetical protein